MSHVLRTHTLSQTRGFAKALIGTDDQILGFTAFGAEASEMMAVVQTAMLGGLPYTALRDAIFTHPTAAEGLIGMFANPPADPGANSRLAVVGAARAAVHLPAWAPFRDDRTGSRQRERLPSNRRGCPDGAFEVQDD